jgi:outer membrane receptor protein involved in Fe transport
VLPLIIPPVAAAFAAAHSASSFAAAGPGASESSVELAEVVVTARLREEDSQKVPIAIQVITGETLSRVNTNSLQELAQTTPGVYASDGLQNNSLYIRGVGSGDSPIFDQSVGTFVDGVFRGRSRTSDALFFDFDRIEVLKGPQSTYFGNNATAGALNMITRKPTADFERYSRVLYGMHGRYAVEAAAGGPLSDVWGFRLAGTYNGMNDGWIESVATGKDEPRQRNLGGRLSLSFMPTESLDAVLKIEGGRHDMFGSWTNLPFQWNRCPAPAPLPASANGCSQAIAQGIPIGLDTGKTAGLPGQGKQLSNFESVLSANYQIGAGTLTSISAYSTYDFDSNIDTEYLLQNSGTSFQFPENYDQLSQELRYTSPAGVPFEYMVGAYFQSGRLQTGYEVNYLFSRAAFGSIAAIAPYLPLAANSDVRQNEKMYSGFGSVGWNATDRLKLTAGLRGMWVDKKVYGNYLYGTGTETFGGFVPLPAAVVPVAVSLLGGQGESPTFQRSDNDLMPSAGIQFQITPSAMTYATYNRSFKAGGINAFNPLTPEDGIVFEPEHANAYEVGVKSKLLGNTLLVNFDVFRTEYRNLQVIAVALDNPLNTKTPSVRNAASSLAEGVELETQWQATKDFRLTAAVTYLDSHYVRFPNASAGTLQTFCRNNTNYNNNPAYCSRFSRPVPAVRDVSGQPTNYAPKWSGNLNMSYGFDLPQEYRVTTFLDSFVTSKYNYTDDLYRGVDGYVRLDMRIALDSPDHTWNVDLIGKNLTSREAIPEDRVWAAGLEPRNVSAQFVYRW